MKQAKLQNTRFTHTRLALNLFAAHYRQAPLQAAAILIGIVLAVTLFVAVQAINSMPSAVMQSLPSSLAHKLRT